LSFRSVAESASALKARHSGVARISVFRCCLFHAAAGARCDYCEMASNHGHDAFLAEPDTLVRLLTPVFD
jgi:hypothetical protein